jgi:hypothetical protein
MSKIPQRETPLANADEIYKPFESRLAALMAENGILVTRLALGVIFLWFGILKFVPGLSEAEDLAKRTLVKLTFGYLPAQVCVYILAVWECAIGLGFLSGRFLRSTLIFARPATSWHVPPAAFLSSGDMEANPIRTNARGAVHPEKPCPYIRRHYHWFDHAGRQDCFRSRCRTNWRRHTAYLRQVSPAVPA